MIKQQTVQQKRPRPATPTVGEQSLRFLLEREMSEMIAGIEPAGLRPVLGHATSGGKRVRPMLTMMSCAAVGGNPAEAIHAAVAIELLHASSLVHDDIMDRAEIRRANITVHRLAGTETAILTGDLLIALAYRSLAKTHADYLRHVMAVFTDAFVSTCEGQAEDVSNGTEAGDAGHTRMVEKKTARLIEAAAVIGGILGGAKQVQIQALRGFGLSIGMAYQANDDLLDAIGSPDDTGKLTGVDNSNGRTTFLSASEDPAGSIAEVVKEYTARAYGFLDLLPDSPHRATLRILAESLMGRKK